MATLAFVVSVAATPVTWPLAIAIQAVGLVGVLIVGRVPIRPMMRRFAHFAPLVAFLALMVATGHPARASMGFWRVAAAVAAKASLAFAAVLALSATTPLPRLLGAMRRLGVPRTLVAILFFMDRYARTLADELARMVLARRSRTFRRGLDFGLLTGLIGVLFVRSMERGERVHAAMLARGWDGTIRTLDEGDGR